MNLLNNILTIKYLKTFSLLIALLFCFNTTIQNEEEVRERETEIEIVITQNNLASKKKEVQNKIQYKFLDLLDIKSRNKIFTENFNFPFKKSKLYIFHCQLTLCAY